MKKANEHKSISRIDSSVKKMHGWYVRVYFNGVMHSKYFNDDKYGGKEAGLQAAIAHRNEVEAEIGKPRTDRVVVTNSPRNTSGAIGVRRAMKGDRDKSGVLRLHPVYEVLWFPEPGRLSRTSVSIEKHGEAKAFEMAVAKRKEKEKEMYAWKKSDES